MGYFITKTKNALLATLNREGARAGELLEQGTVCYLNESDGRLYACKGSEDVPIGITAQAYNEGALVKLIYTGITYVPKSKVSVQVGDTLYVGENGQLSSEGPLVAGYVVEDDQEHYTVNLTAFGTEIAEGGGGGGGGSEPIPLMLLATDEEVVQITEDAWKHSVIVAPNENHPTSVIREIIINVPDEVAEPGYQFTQVYMVSVDGNLPPSGSLELGFNGGLPMYYPEEIPLDTSGGMAAFEILWTYVDTEFFGMPVQGWMPSVTISSVDSGGSAASALVPLRVLTDDAVSGVLTVPVDAWGQTLFWLPDVRAPITGIAFSESYPIDAPIGTQLIVMLTVRADDPVQLGYIDVADGRAIGGSVASGPTQNRIYVSGGWASGLVVFTRVAEDPGALIPDGWVMQVIPATPNDEAYAAVYGEVEFVSPPFVSREIGINESLFGKTLMIPVDVSEISEEAIKSNGLMIIMGAQYLSSLEAPVGTKIDLSYTVHAEVPDGTLLGVIGNQNMDGSGGFATGSVVFYNANAPVYFYQESATVNISLYRVNTTGGDGAPPLDGWFGVVNNNSQPNQLGGDSRVYRYYDSGSLTEEDTWTLPDDHITNIINVGYFGGTVRVGGNNSWSPYLDLPPGKIIKTTFISENGIFFEENGDITPGTRGEVLLQMPAGSSKHRNADLYMLRYVSDAHPRGELTPFDGWIAWVNGDAGGKGSFDIYNEAHWSIPGENLSIDEGMNELAERLHAAEGTISTLSSTISTLNSTISGLTSRISALEEQNLNTRLTTVEGYNANTRLNTLESVNADTRISTLEGQNLNSRLTTIEDDTIPSLDSRVTALEGA